MKVYLRRKGKIKQEGYANKTFEGLLILMLYLAFYCIHFKYGLKVIVIEIYRLKKFLVPWVDFFFFIVPSSP